MTSSYFYCKIKSTAQVIFHRSGVVTDGYIAEAVAVLECTTIQAVLITAASARSRNIYSSLLAAQDISCRCSGG